MRWCRRRWSYLTSPRFAARFEFAPPTKEELEEPIRDEAHAWQKTNPARRIRIDRETLDRLIMNLTGIPSNDARRLARGANRDDGAFTAST